MSRWRPLELGQVWMKVDGLGAHIGEVEVVDLDAATVRFRITGDLMHPGRIGVHLRFSQRRLEHDEFYRQTMIVRSRA